MLPKNLLAAAALPLLASVAMAQVESQLIGLTRTNAALRFQGANCTALSLGCATGLPATVEPWAGGTAYDATSGQCWVSEGNVLARVDARGCTVTCGPWAAPVLLGVVTGLEVLETQNQLMVLDSAGTLTTLSLNGSCGGPQLLGSCGTGLPRVGQRVTSGLAADEMRGLIFYAYTDFATGANQIAVAQLGTTCTPFDRRALPTCVLAPFGSVRGLAVDAARGLLFATDGNTLLAVPYTYDPASPGISYGVPRCCPNVTTTPDPLVGLALRPSPGEPVGQSCANGLCAPCPSRHTLLTGPVIGNPNLLFHLDNAQDNALTWLAVGFGGCRQVGPTLFPLCGPVLVAGASVATPPLVSGPYPVTGPGTCQGSATVVVNFPYDPAFVGTDWSSQFLSLCVGPVSPAFGTAMSNCLSWTVGGP